MVQRWQMHYLYEDWEKEYFEMYGSTLSDLKLLAVKGLATNEQLKFIKRCESSEGKLIVNF